MSNKITTNYNLVSPNPTQDPNNIFNTDTYLTENWTKVDTALNNLNTTKLNANANAVSATKLQTARNINGISFDGTANITLPNVTTSVNGLMIATDKTKLDAINQALATTSSPTFADLTTTSNTNGSTWSRTFFKSFGSVANQKIDVYWTGEAYGTIEVELTSGYNFGNAIGKILKRFVFGGSDTGAIYTNTVEKTETAGSTLNFFGIGDISWDATNSRWKFTIAQRSGQNAISIRIKILASKPDYLPVWKTMTLSETYTTDTTDIINVAGTWVNGKVTTTGNVGIGTSDIEAWHTDYKTLQLGNGSALMGTASAPGTNLVTNAYYDTVWKYKTTNMATKYTQLNTGVHTFSVAPSGTADTALTWVDALTINNSGNVGIGTSDIEAWSSGYRSLQIGTGTTLAGGISANATYLNTNAYLKSDESAWLYKNTNASAMYLQSSNGSHTFNVAPSGTIDTAITWTTALTLANNGNVGIGNSSLKTWKGGLTALQIGGIGAINADTTVSASGYLDISNNMYISSGGTGKTIIAGSSTLYRQTTGQHQFFVAPTNTIDTNIAFTAALTLAATGAATFANTVNATTFVGALTGNASAATKLVTARTINGISFDGTANITLPNATTSVNGLMSAADKVKLNSITSYEYEHPATHPATMIIEDATHRFVTDAEKVTWNAKAPTANPTFTGTVNTPSLIATDITNGYIYEKTFSQAFTGNASNKADIYWTGNYYGTLEVEVIGNYTNANGSGNISKSFNLGFNGSDTYLNKLIEEKSYGAMLSFFGLTDVTWDATNSRWRITVAAKTTTTQLVTIRVKATATTHEYLTNIKNLQLTSIYTNDATVITNQSAITFGNNVSVGDTNTLGFSSNSLVVGQFGNLNASNTFAIGNGLNNANYGLAFKVGPDGVTYADGAYNATGADIAEYYEWSDGNLNNEDRTGYFVTLEEDKIRIVNELDDYILGVVSATPSVVGDANNLRWKNKYVNDDFGRIQYHDVDIEEESIDEYGETITIIRTEKQPILNPEYNPESIYIPREERPEWSPIGLNGKLIVYADETVQVNGYCKPNINGIATSSTSGYRIIKRINENLVKIVIK